MGFLSKRKSSLQRPLPDFDMSYSSRVSRMNMKSPTGPKILKHDGNFFKRYDSKSELDFARTDHEIQ